MDCAQAVLLSSGLGVVLCESQALFTNLVSRTCIDEAIDL